MTPLVKMYTLGHTFMPPGIHAGGLRYHGMAPLVSELVRPGATSRRALTTRTPSSRRRCSSRARRGSSRRRRARHAIRAAIDEALAAKEAGEARVILFNLSGHGYFDLRPTTTTSPASSRTSRTRRRQCARGDESPMPDVPGSRTGDSRAEHRSTERKRILTGIRPTGSLHLGHYAGALKHGSSCRTSTSASS